MVDELELTSCGRLGGGSGGRTGIKFMRDTFRVRATKPTCHASSPVSRHPFSIYANKTKLDQLLEAG